MNNVNKKNEIETKNLKEKETTKELKQENKQNILHSSITESIKVKMIVDPSIRRMSITYDYLNKIKTITTAGNSIKDWPTNLIKINLSIIKNFHEIINSNISGAGKVKDIVKKNEELIRKGDCEIELELYIEKPRISQKYRGKTVEKGYAYRIHWVIGAIISMISIIDKVNITKLVLVPANKWYFGLRLPKAPSEKRKIYSIEHAEEIVKEYNIEVEKLKGDEADSINMWYWLKEIGWEIPTTKLNNKVMIVQNRSTRDKNYKNLVRELLNK